MDISRIDLRIGRIVKAERHPDADTLYIEDVETGEEKNRTVISGLVNFIPIEEVGSYRLSWLDYIHICHLKVKLQNLVSYSQNELRRRMFSFCHHLLAAH